MNEHKEKSCSIKGRLSNLKVENGSDKDFLSIYVLVKNHTIKGILCGI